jgi:Protein of unknown function (DUF3631)
VSLADILDHVHDQLTRFVVFPTAAEPAFLTLWVAHTHAIEAAYATPYLHVHSPVPRSGKSTLLEVLASLVARPYGAANITPAALFRLVDVDKPTLLLDEIDAQFQSDPETAGAMRSIINAGYRRGSGSKVTHCEGREHLPRSFETFCPKALAGIDDPYRSIVHASTRDRTVPIRLERKTAADAIERWRPRLHEAGLHELRDRLGDAIAEHLGDLHTALPEVPAQLNDRAQEVFEPLFAIAEAAGGAWPGRLRDAALALAAEPEEGDEPIAIELLAHVRTVFAEQRTDRLFTEVLCGALKAREEWPWRDWGSRRRQPGLAPGDVAKLLRPFRIKPLTVRVGGRTKKGYKVEQFADAWERYLPIPAVQTSQPSPDWDGGSAGVPA